LSKGKTEDVVVGSKGTLQLGRAAESLVGELKDVWSINSIVLKDGTVYLGTSPNGGIYEYSLGKLTKIYPLEEEGDEDSDSKPEDVNESGDANEPNDVNEPGDANTVEQEQYLANEHIFAMATDAAGRLLAGISGDECKLMRLEAGRMETIFVLGTPYGEPNDAKGNPPCGGTKYIFAIAVDDSGDIYLGTGPQGKLYHLDSSGTEPQLAYDSRDKNILSLAIGRDGFIYAGSDSRGLIYKIDPSNKTATVLYDSDQPEITALLFAEDGNLYAAATSAKIAQAEVEFAAQLPFAGRPEPQLEGRESSGESEGGLKLQIANTKKTVSTEPPEVAMPPRKPPEPSQASYIYKITEEGYVTDVFGQTAVFFCLAAQEQKLLVGTGNSGRTFSIEPALEEQALIYEDKQASQITAVAVAGEDVYLGTANPAKLVKLARVFASEGTYASDLVDAGQPARWGKLQIEADIPQGCKAWAASRSGNVKDVNDPTFSDWTELVEVTGPMQLRCPLGRFCQYKLVLESKDGRKSPLVREIVVASTVPNLAPKVESVSASRQKAPAKTGIFKIDYKSKDDNDDNLIYKIDFRKLGRTNWIELEDELEANFFEWDSKTVEDGRYEIRITASDERSNSTTTKLTGTRISEPVVVDNTAPAITDYFIGSSGKTVTLKLKVSDELTVIGKLDYTLDSNAEWKAAVPDDLVYDTTDEQFTIVLEELSVGEHVIAVKLSDDVGNTLYRTFELYVDSD
jgi:outer membrane protein assembly factor BamB